MVVQFPQFDALDVTASPFVSLQTGEKWISSTTGLLKPVANKTPNSARATTL